MAGRASPTRYDILFKLASGGMATVYVGTAHGAMGFRQVVAIKEPHPHLLDDKDYRRELIAEARLASMIHHVNVVDVRDVEASSRTIRLIMDYIEGASLGELLVLSSKAGQRLPPGVVLRIALDACAGLHAAHELIDEKDRKVGLVHRDVSPQNLLVGLDGTTRVSDFGVAKATAASVTTSGTLKGKIAYMAPEYLEGREIDRRVDVFALGVVVWEAMAGKRLFRGQSEAETVQRVLLREAPLVSSEVPGLGAQLDAALTTALAKKPEERFATAQAFAAALEASAKSILASHSEVAALVAELAKDVVEARRMQVRAKLSQEPGLLSLMGAPPPSLPQSEPAPSSAAATTVVDHPPLGVITLPLPAQPAKAPPPPPAQASAALPAQTRPQPQPQPQPHAQPQTLASEVSAHGFDMETAAGVPSARSGVARLVAVALLLGGVLGGVALVALHKTSSTSAKTDEPTTTASASASAAIRSTSSAEETAASVAPLPSLAPLATHGELRAAHTHAPAAPPATGPATATSTARAQPTDGPPPNPY